MSASTAAPTDFLRRSLASGRIHSAYLFSGPGDEPRTAALDFARGLVCSGDEAARPCDACPGCTRSAPRDEIAIDGTGKRGPLFRHVGDHPDLLWVERGSDDSRVRIGQIRAVQNALRLGASEGGRRAVVIADAEWLNQGAQNALLKLLEEPPDRTTAVLVSSSPAGLLATVRSRCQKVAFEQAPSDPLSDPENRDFAERMGSLSTASIPAVLDWAEEFRGARAPAAAEVERLLLTGSAWLRARVREDVAGARVQRLVDAHRELASCRKTLVQRNANPQMVAERALLALREAATPVKRPYYVTTPIYYVNAEPHIGHTYTTVVADTAARYHRLAGEDTFFLTGTDEHGEKIAEVAAQQGTTPAEVAARYSAAFRDTWESVGFAFDRFIRTTDAEHVEVVQNILQQVHDAGDIYFKEYDGLYCVGCERFLTERDMKDGLCADHERAPERRKESNYFFRMTQHFEWLADHIASHPDFIRPERYKNEALAMLREESGLGDLCISRPKDRLEWGIELPFDDGYVCYVWFDALINYLTGAGYPDDAAFASRWSAAEHFVAKDILKPHAIFWPTMLRSIGLPPYQHLNVHGYWNVDARKVSKTLGNMISPLVMQEKYGFEAFRFFLLRDMVFGLDSNFSEEALVARVNADLANNLGNLVSRTLNMTARYAGGRVPECGPLEALEQEVAAAARTAAQQVDAHMRRCEIHRAVEVVFELVGLMNRYLEQRAPWKAAKEPGQEQQVATTLYTSCESLRCIGLLLAPFLPQTSAAILERLGLPDALATARLPDDVREFGSLRAGTSTTVGPALFPRIAPPQAEAG